MVFVGGWHVVLIGRLVQSLWEGSTGCVQREDGTGYGDGLAYIYSLYFNYSPCARGGLLCLQRIPRCVSMKVMDVGLFLALSE